MKSVGWRRPPRLTIGPAPGEEGCELLSSDPASPNRHQSANQVAQHTAQEGISTDLDRDHPRSGRNLD
jgi:predicted Zn-dependent protease